jgi:glutamate dehydrogenase
MNAVLPVRRDANGAWSPSATAGAPLESYVLCLLNDDLPQDELDKLTIERIQMVARDAAIVHRDAVAMGDRMTAVAAAAAAKAPRPARKWPPSSSGPRTKASSPSATPTTSSSRACANSNATSRAASACCRTPSHPVYGTCLAEHPGRLRDPVQARRDPVDREGRRRRHPAPRPAARLHRRARHRRPGQHLGEHCFVGLFTRAATSTPLARLPFARGRVAKC